MLRSLRVHGHPASPRNQFCNVVGLSSNCRCLRWCPAKRNGNDNSRHLAQRRRTQSPHHYLYILIHCWRDSGACSRCGGQKSLVALVSLPKHGSHWPQTHLILGSSIFRSSSTSSSCLRSSYFWKRPGITSYFECAPDKSKT